MKNKKILFYLFLFSCFLSIVTCHTSLFAADPSSTNFQITESYLPAGRANTQSSSYKIAEGGIDPFAKAAATSTNYAIDGKTSIAGTEQIPYISSITPANYSKFFTDESASFTVAASTPDGDTLQYRAKQDGTVKAGPQTSSTLSWTLGASDQGRHALTFEVIDPQGTVLSTRADYICRRPIK